MQLKHKAKEGHHIQIFIFKHIDSCRRYMYVIMVNGGSGGINR
jgi:hypothetical protein